MIMVLPLCQFENMENRVAYEFVETILLPSIHN